jgi:hypothetical protein
MHASFALHTDQISGVLYASTSLSGKRGFDLLKKAVNTLLASVEVDSPPSVLWSTQYQHRPTSGTELLPADSNGHILRFPPPSVDLAFDDTIFEQVKDVWEKIMGGDAGEFLVFQDREAYDDEV